MSKIITDDELLKIVKQAINQKDKPGLGHSWRHQTNPEMAYRRFLQSIGNAVASYYGGELLTADAPCEVMPNWTLSFGWDLYVPHDGGVWASIDQRISVTQWRQETTMSGFELHTVITAEPTSPDHF